MDLKAVVGDVLSLRQGGRRELGNEDVVASRGHGYYRVPNQQVDVVRSQLAGAHHPTLASGVRVRPVHVMRGVVPALRQSAEIIGSDRGHTY
ncbi:hypothetical protein GCM10028828_03040 [Corynebacterium tapiri]